MRSVKTVLLALIATVVLSTSGVVIAKPSDVDTDMKPMDEIQCAKVNKVWECIIYVT